MSRPMVGVDLTDPDLWLAGVPHEEFRRLRREAPVAWCEHPGGHRGFWAVTRHRDLLTISRDPATFSSRDGVITLDDLDPDQLEARRTMLAEDPPRHRKLRGLTSAHFTPAAVRAHEGMVRALTERLVGEILETGEVDLVAALAEKVPIRVLARIMGVPDQLVDQLVDLGNRMIGSDDPEYGDAPMTSDARLLPFGNPAALEAFEIAWLLAEDRRREPTDDVITALARGTLEGRTLTPEEVGTYFLLLVIAGNETTRHTITSGVMALAENPAEWERLRRGEVDTTRAADEILRWATAIHFHRRVATRDVGLGGVDVAAGDKVVLYFASANYDEDVFTDPHRLDLGRSPNDHVSFGRGGPHFCLGAHLARLEVRVTLETLAARVRRIEVVGPALRLRSNHINGVKHLPVLLHPV
ncbi:MAG: cytochrome P450 [Actinobacteria bacterium]|nr:cytochrome P450 [Actinomycetota bacterium]